jgi:hypothetical protein
MGPTHRSPERGPKGPTDTSDLGGTARRGKRQRRAQSRGPNAISTDPARQLTPERKAKGTLHGPPASLSGTISDEPKKAWMKIRAANSAELRLPAAMSDGGADPELDTRHQAARPKTSSRRTRGGVTHHSCFLPVGISCAFPMLVRSGPRRTTSAQPMAARIATKLRLATTNMTSRSSLSCGELPSWPTSSGLQ